MAAEHAVSSFLILIGNALQRSNSSRPPWKPGSAPCVPPVCKHHLAKSPRNGIGQRTETQARSSEFLLEPQVVPVREPTFHEKGRNIDETRHFGYLFDPSGRIPMTEFQWTCGRWAA
jgi:hypothetical protein